eukprot:GFKZ01014944.1.p1 GENE.GFKZ01014944.1~~GFKZ01014944.1.p1  ORF type:complete len:333 (+),score=47.70 GFKZ01014944.1:1232-2230(+)
MHSHTAFIPTSLTPPLSTTLRSPTLCNSHTMHPVHRPRPTPRPSPTRLRKLIHRDPPAPPLSAPPTRILFWHHTDLRIHDNPALLAAANTSNPLSALLPVATAHALHPNAKPLLSELAASWHQLGSRLLTTSHASPEVTLLNLCRRFNLNAVYFNRSVFHPQVAVERRVERALENAGIAVKAFWGNMLLEPTAEELRKVPCLQEMVRKRQGRKVGVVATPERVPPLPEGGLPRGMEWVVGKMGGGTSAAEKVLGGMQKERELLLLRRDADLIVRLQLYLEYGAVSASMVARRAVQVVGCAGGRTFTEMVWRDRRAMAAHKGASDCARSAVPV